MGNKYDEETIIVRDRIYIPVTQVEIDYAKEAYTRSLYDEKTCKRCPNKPERHNFECDNCPAYKGTVTTCNQVYKNGVEYFGAPLGDRLNVEKTLGIDFSDFHIVDKRIANKFDYPVKMKKSFQLRDYQDKAEKAWFKKKHGIIVAPPRSGKTPTMLHLCCTLGYRTILLANQHEFLKQFIDHVEEFTNLPYLQRETGLKLYGTAKKMSDFETLQICVSTYQQFMDSVRGKERFKMASKQFGTLMVDEVHKANANEFAKVINSWPSRVRLGVTGTDKRKDGRHFIVKQIIGPVVERIEIDQMQPKIIVHVCDYVKTKSQFRGPAGFVYACKFLAKHEKRNEEIMKYILKDLAKGHSIIIPVYHKDQIAALVQEINYYAGAGTAEAFVGGGTKKNKELRNNIIERCRSGETKVVVGVRSILQLGHNVPRWSALYYIQPMSNEPNWKQESSRVLTPMENKRTPIIRMFVDPNVGLSLGCFISTYKSSISFKHKPTPEAIKRAGDMFELHSGSRSGAGGDDDYGYEIEHEGSNYSRSEYGISEERKDQKRHSGKINNKKASSKLQPKGIFSNRSKK